jgi:alkylhydroperoxidase family enzyme
MISYPIDYSERVFVPLPTDQEITAESKKLLDAAAPLNVARMFSGTGDMFAPIAGLIQAVFETKGIDVKIRELIILRTAKQLNCPYEWDANTQMAKNAGCTADEVKAMGTDGPVSGLSDEIVLICRAVDELTIDGSLEDETLTAMMKAYDVITVRKLILMISWFNLLSRFLNGCRVQLESGDHIGHRTSPV